MGCDLRLESENDSQLDELPDPRGYVGVVVELAAASKTMCLRFIDPYGDTTFNRVQVPVLIEELLATRELVTDEAIAQLAQRRYGAAWRDEAVSRALSSQAVRAHVEQMLKLARRCHDNVHTYLKFYGD